jgi:ligand-binding SRPBCC domain-containing protein
MRKCVRIHALERRQRVAGRPPEVFEFFADAYNLAKITPPWLRFKVRSQPLKMVAGAEIRYSLRLHGLPIRWISRIDAREPPHQFVDVQLHGPYRLWHHTHSLEPGDDHVLMRDAVRYALPFGPLGELVHRALVRRDLERIFDFRSEAIEHRFGSRGYAQHRGKQTDMDATEIGHTALVGWREKVADGVARPVSERTRLADDQVRALLGAIFFALSLYYVVATVRRALTAARS